MKTINKLVLVSFTNWLMVLTTAGIAIWFFGYVVVSTFDLAVFAKKTSDFMFAFIGFATVIVLCSAILNISLNIGLIAEKTIQELEIEEPKKSDKKWFWGAVLVFASITFFLFFADFLTRRMEQHELVSAADYIVKTYDESIHKIATGIQDTAQVNNIPQVLRLLSSLRIEYPTVMLITADSLSGQQVLLQIHSGVGDRQMKLQYFGNSFYSCYAYDCDYLQTFFNNQSAKPLFWTEKSNYKLYYPMQLDGVKFVLVFSKYQFYGKTGS